MKDRTRWKIILLIALLIFLDLWTKELAKSFLKETFTYSNTFPYGGIAIFEGFLSGIDFSLGYVENKGAAFGFFHNFPKILLLFRLILVSFLGYLVFFKEKKHIVRLGLSFVIAGALGNLADVFRQQYVIDFLNFHFYGYPFPLFNLADSLITIGGVMLIFFEIPIFKKFTEDHLEKGSINVYTTKE